jgi:histidine kinase
MSARRISLRTRLLLSFAVVGAVGIGAFFVTARLTAPSFFETRLAHITGRQPQGRGPGAAGGGTQAAELDAELDSAMTRSLNYALLIGSGVALAVGGAGAFLLARQLSHPARRLAEASRGIAAGDYAQRVPEDGPPEVAGLAQAFNTMAASLHGVEQRRRELIGDVAHELRSPVAILRGYLEGLADGVLEPAPEVWERLFEETGRMSRIVDDLGQLSRAEAGQLALDIAPLDAGIIAQETAERMRPEFDARGIKLAVQTSGRAPVMADRDRLVQILTNLLSNARNYTPTGGSVLVDVRAERGAATIAVRDTGAGLAADHLAHVFERFYRVDRSRSRASGGSGVGLTIARALAVAMGGTLTAKSPGVGRGSTFTLRLPLAAGQGPQLEQTLSEPRPGT